MTGPTPDQLAPNIDPAVRDYVQAVLKRAEQRHEVQLDAALSLAIKTGNELRAENGLLSARLNVLEAAINLVPATRRRMEALVALLETRE